MLKFAVRGGMMDVETLLTGAKWEILKALAKEKKAPIDLAKETQTSLANASQQLRLLETAALISVERVLGRQRNQPRMLYSIPEAKAFIAVIAPNTVKKKLLKPSKTELFVLKSLLFENKNVRETLLSVTPIINELETAIIGVENHKVIIQTKPEQSKKAQQIVKTLGLNNIEFKEVTPNSEIIKL